MSESHAPALIRAGKAAELLGTSRATLYRLVEAGELPVVRMPGAELLFRRAELERWLDGDLGHTREAAGAR